MRAVEPHPAVLFVDDDANVLASLRRTLRGQPYEILTACGAAEALACLEARPVDALVTDLNMPGMDGNVLLANVRERWPDTVRMMLTGQAELAQTIASINRGEIYRYIVKPWDGEELCDVILQGLERAQLRRERDQLHRQTLDQAEALQRANATLEERVRARTEELREAHEAVKEANAKLRSSFFNSIRIFGNLLEMRADNLGGHGRRVAELARRVARALGSDEQEVQDVFIAALLHDVGKIGLPDGLLQTATSSLKDDALRLYRQHAERGEQVLMAVDELRGASRLIRSHHERFDGRGFPDGLAGFAIPLGARILAVVNDYDDLLSGSVLNRKVPRQEALKLIERGRGSRYDPDVTDCLLEVLAREEDPEGQRARKETLRRVDRLEAGDVVARDLIASDGMLLLSAGHVLSERLIELLRAYEMREEARLAVNIVKEE